MRSSPSSSASTLESSMLKYVRYVERHCPLPQCDVFRPDFTDTLQDPPVSRPMNILVDKEFLQANKMFESQCKSYVREGNPKLKHYPTIEEGDMKKIMTYLKPYESPTNLYSTCGSCLDLI